MAIIRRASAHWEGSGKEGTGTVSTQSKVMNAVPYAFNTRFEDSPGTNPEELVGAAHAACFSMKLSFVIGEMGYLPEAIDTTAKITFDNGTITNSHLNVKARVPGMSAEQFKDAAENAKLNCPLSKLLKAEISMDAELLS